MDVFSAMQTAVSGLNAQAYALDNISGNIANTQTVGFKGTDTDFVDLVAEQPANRQVSGSVAGFSSLTTGIAGNIAATGVPTNMALNGSGFFVVQSTAGTNADGTPIFSGTDMFTRRGDFTRDRNGYLVNGAGYYLSGSSIDPATGQTSGTGIIQLSSASTKAQPTTSITYAANLPTTPQTANYSSTVAGSELYTPAKTPSTVITDPTVTNLATPPTVASADATDFVRSSIAGPSLTAYTNTGTPVTVQTRWAKVANADAASGTQDTWNLFYGSGSSSATSNGTWTNVGTAFTFAGGQLTHPDAATTPSVTIAGLTVDGTKVGDVSLAYGTGGFTEYASTSGETTTNTLKQNGYGAGSLNALSVGVDGSISGSYSNGNTQILAKVGIARFQGEDFLQAGTGGVYSKTLASGEPISDTKNVTVIGGNVEQSNTDIAKEFSKMIVTQQAYSANTRVITTAQQMISDLLNVIR